MSEFPKVEQPKGMKIELFPHQLTAIHLMEERESKHIIYLHEDSNYTHGINTKISIFADIVGYGKTFSIIGLIVRDKMKWDTSIEYEQSSLEMSDIGGRGILRDVKKSSNKYCKVNTTIIVVNNSLINQWHNELKKTELKVKVVKKSKEISESFTDHDIVLVSSKMYNKFVNEWSGIAWKRFIFDEPQSTVISSMKTVCAGHYWLISATPLSLYHRYNSSSNHFLYSIFNSRLEYDIFKSLLIKNDDDYVRRSYKLPEVKYIYHECYQPVYNMVNGYVDNTTLSLISAGDISGAIERLGGNETSNIVDLVKTKKQNRIDQIKLWLSQYPTHRHVDKWNQEINKLEREILELKEKFEEKLRSTCPICMDELEQPIMVPCCQNMFCGKCFFEWRKNNHTCALCREHIVDNRLIHITKEEEDKHKDEHEPIERKFTKPETVVKIIENNKNGKFILFSDYDISFDKVKNIMKNTNISYAELKGHSTTINKRITEFKNGKLQVLYLNSNYNGAGINLQEATDIIFYHTYTNDNVTKQIIGRANRIGRKGDLFVHTLI